MFTISFPRHSLKTRILLAIVALFVGGVWSLSFFISQMLRDSMQNQLGEQQRSTVAYVATQIDKEFVDRIETLELISRSIDAAQLAQPDALQRNLDRQVIAQRMFNAGIWATDRNGTAIVDTLQPRARIGTSYSDRKYFQDTVDSNQATISEPIMGRALNRTIIVFAVPLHDKDGRVIGVLCGGNLLGEPSFLDSITHNRYGKSGGFLLVSPGERLIITASDERRVMEKLPAPGVNAGIDRAMNGFRGTEILTNARGVESLISTQNVPSTDWYIAASLPTAEAFAPIIEMHRNIALATLLLSVLSAGIIWWVLKRQLLPLETSARKLEDMRIHGQAPEPLPIVRGDEIGTLITAFNDLLAALQKREQALLESETRFKALHDASFGGIAIHDAGVILDCNQGLVDMTGFSKDELVGMDGLLLIAPDWRDRVRKNIAEGHEQPYEIKALRKDGSVYPCTIGGRNIPYKGCTVRVTEFRDITERKQAEQQQRIAAIAFESQEGMFITDAEHRIVRANQAFTQITGYTIDDIAGETPRFLGSGRHPPEFFTQMLDAAANDGGWQGEVWNRRKNGEDFPSWLTITAVRDNAGSITHYVGSLDDITLRKMAEEEIKHLAFFDQLTGLPNRRLLADRLKHALAASCRHRHCGALLFIDLDNFKTLNDTLGHDQGDALLRQVGERLSACVRDGDTVARLGGDEFIVMLETLDSDIEEAATQAEMIGEKIVASLDRPYILANYEHHSSASIGIAMISGCDDVADEILRRADMAMYQAKSAGRKTLRFFDPKMQAVVLARAALEAGLREAVQKMHFTLVFQPQVDSGCRVIGAEALLRWTPPESSEVSPRSFVPLAEETGLILPIGQWVLDTACEHLAGWADDQEMAGLTIAVNISARQFQQKDFVDNVLRTIRRHHADPRRLKLELTESMLVHDVDDVVDKMQALKAAGIGLSLDDFGTGYSSLTYLKRLPLDQLKIDQGFVRDILTDPDDAIIARMIVSLGENFGLKVIAEGVESEAQLLVLAQHGCNYYQGYLFSPPLAPAAFEAYVKDKSY